MLARQVAPLLRKFCKVSAYFTIASQRGHALTMLRSFKVILNFSTQYHVAHADSLPSFQHVNNITNFPQGARLRQRPRREYFERLVNADEHPARCCRKLRTTWAAAPDAVHRPAFGHGDQAFALSLFPGSPEQKFGLLIFLPSKRQGASEL